MPTSRTSAGELLDYREHVTDSDRIALERHNRLVADPLANRLVNNRRSNENRRCLIYGAAALARHSPELPRLRLTLSRRCW